jgi:hypothetical protein
MSVYIKIFVICHPFKKINSNSFSCGTVKKQMERRLILWFWVFGKVTKGTVTSITPHEVA